MNDIELCPHCRLYHDPNKTRCSIPGEEHFRTTSEAESTSDGTCPHCGYRFQELYLQFDSDNAEFDCSNCEKPITGYRDIVFYLHPAKASDPTLGAD